MDLNDLITSLSQLSDDPDRAFFEYEEIKRGELEEALRSDNTGWSNERLYVDQIHVFIEVFGSNNYVSMGEIPNVDPDFADFFWDLTKKIDRAKMKYTLQQAVKSKALTDRVVVLTAESRSAIRALIEAIKTNLETLEIGEAKRRALIGKLNSFLNELDQNLTHTEAFFSFVVQASRTAAEAGAEFKPLAERIDRVLDMIDGAKKWVESLPGFRKPAQIEPPRKQIEDHSEDSVE